MKTNIDLTTADVVTLVILAVVCVIAVKIIIGFFRH